MLEGRGKNYLVDLSLINATILSGDGIRGSTPPTAQLKRGLNLASTLLTI